MKILIFEFISGGGFCQEDLPEALAREGGLMLKALLADFADLPEHEVVVMLDERCVTEFAVEWISIIPVSTNDDVSKVFEKNLNACNAAWIIAPETDNILLSFTQQVEKANKSLLSNPSSAVFKTGDKLQTFNILSAHDIATIPSQPLLNFSGFAEFPQVIKSRYGVGCENNFVVENQTEFQQVIKQITPAENYIVQPFIQGEALSISALFNRGQAQLICLNRQHLQIKNQQFNLLGCEVNIDMENRETFQNLLSQIARGLPDLFGYVGIDVIFPHETNELTVVEINPRLTTSYSGIKKALGVNVAEQVLKLAQQQNMLIKPTENRTVFIDIAQE